MICIGGAHYNCLLLRLEVEVKENAPMPGIMLCISEWRPQIIVDWLNKI